MLIIYLLTAHPLNKSQNSKKSHRPRRLTNLLRWRLVGSDVKPLELNTRARPTLYNCRHYMLG